MGADLSGRRGVVPMSTIPHEKLYESLRLLVESTEKWSESLDGTWDPLSFIQEFRTIRFGVGRRMGHTEMALRLADEYAPGRSIYITSCGLDEREGAKRNFQKRMHRDYPVEVIADWKCPKALEGRDVDLVVIDPASQMSRKAIQRIAKALVSCQPLIVLIG